MSPKVMPKSFSWVAQKFAGRSAGPEFCHEEVDLFTAQKFREELCTGGGRP